MGDGGLGGSVIPEALFSSPNGNRELSKGREAARPFRSGATRTGLRAKNNQHVGSGIEQVNRIPHTLTINSSVNHYRYIVTCLIVEYNPQQISSWTEARCV